MGGIPHPSKKGESDKRKEEALRWKRRRPHHTKPHLKALGEDAPHSFQKHWRANELPKLFKVILTPKTPHFKASR